jgi:hypothetical protein
VSVDTTSTLPKGVQIRWDNDFLKLLKKKLKMKQVCGEESLPKNMGATTDWIRYTPRAPVTAHLTEGSSGSESNMYLVNIRATVKALGNFYKPSTLFKLVGRDPDLKKYRQVVSDEAAKSIDIKAMAEACLAGGWPIRADLDTTFSASGQVTTQGTDEFTSTNFTCTTNGDWTGAHGCFYDADGPNYLAAFVVGDSTTAEVFSLGGHSGEDIAMFSGGSEYPAALANAITTADAARMVAVKDIGATDVISYTNINMALASLQENECEPFDNGYYIGILDSMVAYDLRKDTDWKAVATYKDDVKWLLNGELGTAYGIRWVQTTQPWRHAVNSYQYSATGAVHCVPIFGADAIRMLTLKGQGNHIIMVTGPDKSDPLDQFQTVGWKVINAVKTVNAFGSVLLLCGATAMA